MKNRRTRPAPVKIQIQYFDWNQERQDFDYVFYHHRTTFPEWEELKRTGVIYKFGKKYMSDRKVLTGGNVFKVMKAYSADAFD